MNQEQIKLLWADHFGSQSTEEWRDLFTNDSKAKSDFREYLECGYRDDCENLPENFDEIVEALWEYGSK